MVSGKNRPFLLGLLGLCAALIAAQFPLRHMMITGDEPGYIYKSLSFLDTGGFSMPLARFGAEMPQFQWIVASGSYLGQGHPVFMSLLGAPLLGLFGIAGLRALSTLCGLIMLAALALMLRPRFGPAAALFAAGFSAFTLPVLAYTHLFYTEMMMAMLLAASWALGRAEGRVCALAAVACALLLPFVHIRAAPLAPVLAAFAVFPLWRRGDRRGVALALGLCALGAALFVLQQELLFGRLVAGAEATFPFTLSSAFARLSVQLTEFRHGLFTVNPACILALAGLALGLCRREGLAGQAALLLAVYVPPMVFGTASESWPARFWVVMMPALGVGLAYWLLAARGLPARASGALLLLFAFVNSLILLRHNDAPLLNRTGDLTGDSLFPLHNRFDIAGLLPWDPYDFEVQGMDPAPGLDAHLLHRAMFFCAVLLAAFIVNGLTGRRWTGWLPVAALVPLFAAAAMRPVPPGLVTVSRAKDIVALHFACPAPVRLIRLMAPDRAHMFPPEYPAGLEVTALPAAGGPARIWHAPMAPVVAISAGTYRSVRLSAAGPAAGGIWLQEDFVPLTAGLSPLRCR